MTRGFRDRSSQLLLPLWSRYRCASLAIVAIALLTMIGCSDTEGGGGAGGGTGGGAGTSATGGLGGDAGVAGAGGSAGTQCGGAAGAAGSAGSVGNRIIASTVSPGWDAGDATDAFVKAIRSAAPGDTVVIDKTGDGVWRIAGRHPDFFDCAKNTSNGITVVVEAGVTIEAITGTYDDPLDMLWRWENCSDITLVGWGATLRMDPNQFTSGESVNSLAFYDCRNLVVQGFLIDGSGGDGILVSTRTETGRSENVHIEGVVATHHRRQGMTVTSVDGLMVKDSAFVQTGGTPPNSGIDLEPNYSTQVLKNLHFSNTLLEDNHYTGILVALSKFNGSTQPLSVTFDDTFIRHNWQVPGTPDPAYKKAAIAMGFGGGGTQANSTQGKVVFNRTYIGDEPYRALFTLKHHDAYVLEMNDTFIQNVGQSLTDSYYPIEISRFNYDSPQPAVGNIFFRGLGVREDRDVPFLYIGGDSNDGWSIDDFVVQDAFVATPHEGTGIVNPTGASEGPGTSFTQKVAKAFPQTTVELVVEKATSVRGGAPGELIVKRTSGELGFPIAVEYGVSGSASNGEDFRRLHGIVIIPAGSATTKLSIDARGKTSPDERVTVTLKDTANYDLGSSKSGSVDIVATNCP